MASLMKSNPKKPKQPWRHDTLANKCMNCNKPFGVLTRKHHCRKCGDIFCNKCSKSKKVVEGWGGEKQRVCDKCAAILDKTSNTNT